MIRRPTVLVLGAGASAEYQFPVGRALLLQIVHQLKDQTRLRLDMQLCCFSDDLIRQFANELGESGQPSVDAFLEQHKGNPDYEKLGKAAIAQRLIECEDRPVRRDRTELKLYEYIWHRASTAPDRYASNALSILTFNYDRSFEEFFRTCLSSSHPEFRDKSSAFQAALGAFPVLHLYGSLGTLVESDSSYLKYGKTDDPTPPATILAAADRIKLYHQAKFDAVSLKQIEGIITQAETICFLGFGFYATNIKLLRFCGLGKNRDTRLYASAFGLKRGEQEATRQALNLRIEFAIESDKCLSALRYFPVLIATE